TSTAQNPSHTYTTEGTYTVALTVTGPGGSDTETKTDYITVTVDAPVADFSGTPTSGLKPLDVDFTDASTGEITSWSWNFGDGGSSSAQNPSHTYANAGTYTVALTVTGPGGSDTETKVDYITVQEPAPVADFSGTPTSGDKPLDVDFVDLSTGAVTSWSWNFGDGGTSTEQNPSHTYTGAGTYTVYLTVTGPGGSDTETKEEYITVTEPAPVADFAGDPLTGNKPLNVQFTDLSTGTVTSWSWTFGDGGTSTEQNPSHTYTTEGNYTVTLTVAGPGGEDSETKENYITVTVSAPVAAFSGDPLSGQKPLNVQFTDASTGEITSWAWTFGDGGTSTAQNPSHSYTAAGTYTVALTVTGPGGSDTETKENYITVTEPDIAVDPTAYDFGDVQVTKTEQTTITVSNEGDAVLSISSFSITGTHSDQFSIFSGGDPVAVDPAGSHEVVVQFAPTSEGAKSAALTITSNDDDESPLNVTLTGNGTPEPTPDIAVDPVSHDFGNVQVTKSEQTTITVSNEGDATLSVSSFAITGTHADQFSIVSGGDPVGIEPEGTHEVVVQFAPTSEGAKTAALTITSNDPNESPLSVALTGNGTPAPSPEITVAPLDIDYGTVLIGNTKSDSFTIKNDGDAVLNVSSVGLTGANSDQFAIVNAGPFAIAADASQIVRVNFTPTSEGAKTAMAQVSSNDTDEGVVNVDLAGVGKQPQPQIAVDPENVDFGGVVIGNSKVQDVTVSNDGVAPLNVTSTSIDQETVEHPLLTTAQTTDEFTIVAGGAPFEVAPGESHIIKVQFAPLSEGEKQAILNIGSNDPENEVEQVDLTGVGIYEPPVGRFYATPTSGYPALSIKFEDDSEGFPTAWHWDFGDGATSTEQNPTHVYRRPGLYTVTLTITTTLGDVEVEKKDFIDVWGYGPIYHTPLTLIDNNYAFLKEGWEHAIDEDVSGWVGTTTAKDNPPWAIFGFKDGLAKEINKVALLVDTDVEYRERWTKYFSVYVSTTGIKDGDFVKVLDGTKKGGDWQTFEFDAVTAKYVKLVLGASDAGWRQIGEFRVCPVRPVASAELSSVAVTSPHIGNGVDMSEMTINVADENGQPMPGLTQSDFYLYVHAGRPILSRVVETGIPGQYKTTVANLGGINMPIEVMVNGVIVGKPFITFTEPEVTTASLVLLDGSETVENEGWDNAIDGDLDGWDGTVTATGASPYAIFRFDDSSIKAVHKINVLVDTNVGYESRWVRRFRVQVSTTGMNDTDFTTIYDGLQNQAKWETHMFPAANARFVKLIIDYPTTGMKQLGELELEVGEALTITDPLSGIESILGTPVEFALKDNYPNPFNPETRIEFALPRGQNVTIMVFNQIGQLVRTLYDARLDAGYHTITWNSQNDAGLQLPSGTYFLLFQAEDYRKTLKMLLIK
ncbi:choice-of-anchor D domain-containing protein, partial [candidate division KSB1 bacterium]|nr:choice-of-anchor D domain-containing protein [candidate division KSB1 bacterium]